MKNTLFTIRVAGLKNDGSQAGYPALFCAGFKHVIFRAGFNLLGTSMLILPAGLLGVTHLLVQSTEIMNVMKTKFKNQKKNGNCVITSEHDKPVMVHLESRRVVLVMIPVNSSRSLSFDPIVR